MIQVLIRVEYFAERLCHPELCLSCIQTFFFSPAKLRLFKDFIMMMKII